ncbi:MAG TPA: hypothetical protein VJM50_23540 [Pyrinomonadaceae bacterium]|nr:hypothetical protein [Pyrinomonadaceae bacterium]
MIGTASPAIETTTGLCASCGIPVDSQYFDESSVVEVPTATGDEVVLARFELPPQYCGVLQYFSQFTDALGINFANVQTPTIEWKVLVNNHALFPYINLRHVVNPWGFGSYPVNIRLDEDSIVELVARRVQQIGALPNPVISVIGGRIVGRFWYNASYGDVR